MKKCWDYVKYPDRIRNMPPYTMFLETDDGDFQIVPDVNDLITDSYYGYVEYWDECADDYRGYVISVTDHGNISLLFRYKNGNTKEIWSVVL